MSWCIRVDGSCLSQQGDNDDGDDGDTITTSPRPTKRWHTVPAVEDLRFDPFPLGKIRTQPLSVKCGVDGWAMEADGDDRVMCSSVKLPTWRGIMGTSMEASWVATPLDVPSLGRLPWATRQSGPGCSTLALWTLCGGFASFYSRVLWPTASCRRFRGEVASPHTLTPWLSLANARMPTKYRHLRWAGQRLIARTTSASN